MPSNRLRLVGASALFVAFLVAAVASGHVFFVLRVGNTVMSAFCLVVLITRYRPWRLLGPRLRYYGLALFGILIVSTIGTTETILTNAPGGIRVFLTTAVLHWLVLASILSNDELRPPTAPPPARGSATHARRPV